MRTTKLFLSLSAFLALVAIAFAAKGPKGGPPSDRYVCTGTLTISGPSGTTTEPWSETLFFYEDGKGNPFTTTEWRGHWKKKLKTKDVWKGRAKISKDIETLVEQTEPGVVCNANYTFKKLVVQGGVITGEIHGKIVRKYSDGTKTTEVHQGTFTGVEG